MLLSSQHQHRLDLRFFRTPNENGAAQAIGDATLPWASSRSGAEPGLLSKTAL